MKKNLNWKITFAILYLFTPRTHKESQLLGAWKTTENTWPMHRRCWAWFAVREARAQLPWDGHGRWRCQQRHGATADVLVGWWEWEVIRACGQKRVHLTQQRLYEPVTGSQHSPGWEAKTLTCVFRESPNSFKMERAWMSRESRDMCLHVCQNPWAVCFDNYVQLCSSKANFKIVACSCM